MRIAKDQIRILFQTLPENCTLEDSQYHLYVLEKIRKGEERAQSEETLTQADVEKRMNQWVVK